jgi:hypothetical protein
MNFSQHLLRLVVGRGPAIPESVNIVTGSAARRGAPVFRAPALPTPHQLSNELPFTTNVRPRLRRAS